MKTLDIQKITKVVNGKVSRGDAKVVVTGFSTDSRTLRPGDLFIPLRGEHFDGHDFLLEAVRRGAAACLSEDLCAGLSVPVIMVEDTLTALGDLAATLRAGFTGPVVGVTGSSGKSTTKEMLSAILALTGPGLKSEGNFNNLIGLPLTLLKLTAEHQWIVVEMGASQRGEIARLTQIAQPTVGVITNIGLCHLEGMQGLDGVARAKGELFAGLQPGASAVLNADDPRVMLVPVANGVNRVLYGFSAEAQVRGEDAKTDGEGVSFNLRLPDGLYPVRLPVRGQHNVSNALAAAAAAFCLDIPVELVVRGLEGFSRLRGRMEICPLGQGIILLDDTYNANPLSVTAALNALAEMTEGGRRIAVLGDMLELGEQSEALHFEVGEKGAALLDILILVGKDAAAMGRGAVKGGMRPETIFQCADHGAAAALLRRLLRSGDRVLLKGSRGMKMERVRQLLEESGGISTREV
ncbi:MAG: UDP-N-acetylmuramoyl-tripeptide--D-alanyl-D-alanine ligase [Desulfuromonadaceae bacterium]|nr:UDP-N-acetylmuramoyl-tripeptide--D-alanyl-D-alanine ligase [Desulfuromonadaceae bacterium]